MTNVIKYQAPKKLVPRTRTTQPSVAVVIPCFNYARFLIQAVESVLSQDDVSVQVIIVDDASTDGSPKLARNLARRDRRIEVLAHTTNSGPVDTFNDGLTLVDAEFLVRLDADDLLTPGSLKRATDLAISHPTVGLVYGHPVHFDSDAVIPRARTRVRREVVWPGSQWLAARCAAGNNVITSPEVLMRTSVVDRVGGQRNLPHAHDMEMWLRIAAVSDVGHLRGCDQAWHREHAQSLSQQLAAPTDSLRERRAAFDTLFDGQVPVADSRRLQHVAAEALAREALDRACREFDRGRAEPTYIDELIDFAAETSPDTARLTEWRQLERRMNLGQSRVSRRPWYLGSAVRRRLREKHRYATWTRTGIYERGL